MTFSATYSPEDNKLRLYASSRLDPELYARVRAAGFIWAPKQDLFVAPMWTPQREDLLIELAGDVGDEDTSLVDRAEERADRFDGYRDNRAKDAESARNYVASIADGIPLGQPILVGHHSERHARKDAERIENGMRRAVKMWQTSQYWQSRAAGAIAHAKYKELPGVRARRIKGIEADKRRYERTDAEARRWIAMWGKLDKPYDDGRPCDEALYYTRTLAILNYSRGGTLWSDLRAGKIQPREAQLKCLRGHGLNIAWARRWINHSNNRLAYEMAMLGEQGKLGLLAPKPRPTLLPLCNYRAPAGLDIENMYHRGEMIHYPQVDMSQAEYTAINKDYKGSRIVGRSHRVRTCMQRHSLVCVFLTDAKVHVPPGPNDTPDPPRSRSLPERDRVVHTPRPAPAVDVDAGVFDQMAESLRAGVKVVSAPQLFPTPVDVARQMVQWADIRAGQRVLEPSAGTGRLIDAIGMACDWGAVVVAVEVNCSLASGLRAKYTPEHVIVHGTDFLDWAGPGAFDRIVANPPFDHGVDIRHIERMYELLAPGGRLVTLCANGPRQQAELKDRATVWKELPAGTFDGTGVRAALVVLDKPED